MGTSVVLSLSRPCGTSSPVLALGSGANSPRDFPHGPPRQGARPPQVLDRHRGHWALLAGGRVHHWLTTSSSYLAKVQGGTLGDGRGTESFQAEQSAVRYFSPYEGPCLSERSAVRNLALS